MPRVPTKHFKTNGLATQLSRNPPPPTTPQGCSAPQERWHAAPPPKERRLGGGVPHGTAKQFHANGRAAQ